LNGEVMGKVYTYQDITARKQLEEEERAAHAVTEVLGTTSTALSSSLDIDQVLNTILIQIGRVVPYDAINIMSIENGKAASIRTMGFEKFDPKAAQELSSVQLDIATTPNLQWMFETHLPLVISDIHQYSGWVDTASSRIFHSWAGAPLLAHGQAFAFFSLCKVEPDFYNDDYARYLFIFANQAALAMENARLFAEVKQLALTDPLTGLCNRRNFLELAENAFSNALRYERPLSVIMVDIDQFKRVNDTYGHFVGDYFLKNVGAIFLSRLRQADIKGRFGGEEFMFILPETHPASALRLAESLRSRIANLHLKTEHGRISITISIGLATLDPTTDATLEALLIRADQAMYQAKEAGGNRVQIWQPTSTVIA
jgi:diguanylate cyclase (GGDEF)-like protein